MPSHIKALLILFQCYIFASSSQFIVRGIYLDKMEKLRYKIDSIKIDV